MLPEPPVSRTLTTEEWKAELELEGRSVSCASVSVPVNDELDSFTRGKLSSSEQAKQDIVQLGSRTTMPSLHPEVLRVSDKTLDGEFDPGSG